MEPNMIVEEIEDRDRMDALEERTREKIERERGEVYDYNHADGPSRGEGA